VVVPAHDEEAVLGRLLAALADLGAHDELVVVCDGCTDRTAEVARTHPLAVVVEQPQGGKPSALNAGDRVATLFPRFYVDADIVVTARSLRDVAGQMTGGVVAGAPAIRVDASRSSWAVRRFYDVWTRLPYATTGIIGSGVMGLTREGRSRFGEFPPVIGDDEFVRRQFDTDERVARPLSTFTVTAPRTLAPLLAIKTRSRLGIYQLDELDGPARRESGEPGSSVLPRLAHDPRRWTSLAVYVAVRLVVGRRARRRLARGDTARWDRDDTARQPVS
jgi:hypothetical protein